MNEHKTIFLEALHLKLGANMKTFAGFTMPMHYAKGIIHEHLHTREHAGLFDLSHMVQIILEGDTVLNKLDQLVPSEIRTLSQGQQKYTLFTNESGGIIDDIVITHLGNRVLLIGNAINRHKDLAHLQAHFGSNNRISLLNDHVLLSLQGPDSGEIIGKLNTVAAKLTFMTAMETELYQRPCIISRSGYTGEDGFEISTHQEHACYIVKSLLTQKHIEPVGLGARNTLRLEAGLCLYGQELNEITTPYDVGLQWLVKKGKSNYPGAKAFLENNKFIPSLTRIGLSAEGKLPVRDHTPLFNENDQQLGQITSGSYSPSLGHPIAMALIKSELNPGENPIYATVRSRKIRLFPTKLPFIEHKYFKPQRS